MKKETDFIQGIIAAIELRENIEEAVVYMLTKKQSKDRDIVNFYTDTLIEIFKNSLQPEEVEVVFEYKRFPKCEMSRDIQFKF